MATRPAEIADFLHEHDLAEMDTAGHAAVAREIAARWPDVTANDLDAAFQIVALETTAQRAFAVADQCDRAAIAFARATAVNPIPV